MKISSLDVLFSVFITAVVALTVRQLLIEKRELDQMEPLTVGACYVFSGDKSLGAAKYTVYKIKAHATGVAYTEKTWRKDRGWDKDESISERHSKFYSEVKCPREFL